MSNANLLVNVLLILVISFIELTNPRDKIPKVNPVKAIKTIKSIRPKKRPKAICFLPLLADLPDKILRQVSLNLVVSSKRP